MLGRDCETKAHSHRAKSTSIEPLERSVILENGSADVHRVRAFRDDDVVLTKASNLILNDANRGVVVHGKGLVLGELEGNLRVLFRLSPDRRGPLASISLATGEVCRRKSLVELRQNYFCVSAKWQHALNISMHFERIIIQLNYLDVFSESGWQAKVQDPVEARTTKEDHISVLEDKAASSRGRKI